MYQAVNRRDSMDTTPSNAAIRLVVVVGAQAKSLSARE
jgi:hypothetical protein